MFWVVDIDSLAAILEHLGAAGYRLVIDMVVKSGNDPSVEQKLTLVRSSQATSFFLSPRRSRLVGGPKTDIGLNHQISQCATKCEGV